MNKCNFCGRPHNIVNKLFVGKSGGICDRCIVKCTQEMGSEPISNSQLSTLPEVSIDPRALKAHMDKYVVSQNKAKTILSVAVSNHFKRINTNSHIEKSNVILIGPTGCGKTLMVRTIADYLDLPFVIVDATRLTETGYIGDDVDSFLLQLLNNADGDLEKAQTGIVFLDEIDKIASCGDDKKEVGRQGVQQTLLKMIEGAVFTINNPKDDDTIDFDTRHILFVASGAFSGLNHIKHTKKVKTKIGFSADVEKKQPFPETEFQDLIDFGMIPEFVGRFPIVAELEDLTQDDMLSILVDVENNLVSQYKHLFDYNDIDLTFDKEALLLIVNTAIANKTGARGLRTIMEKVLLPHMFNMNKYSEENIHTLEITKSLINEPREVKKKINAKC